MSKQEYIEARLTRAKNRLSEVQRYLSSEDALKHRNYRKSNERVLARLLEVIPQLERNELTKEYEYFYETLYKDGKLPVSQVAVF